MQFAHFGVEPYKKKRSTTMDTYMTIELTFTNNAFNAKATITPDTSIKEKSFSFILNNNLHISEITCNGKKVDFKKVAEETPEFRSTCQCIKIDSKENINNIEINYSGTIAFTFSNGTGSCWHNIITKDIKSLSWYSVWFPQKTSIAINHDKVIITDGNELFVVKGIFNESQNTWEYGGKGYDPFNIVAYRKEALQTISNEYMNIYFIDDKIAEQAETSSAIYKEVIDFFNGDLFRKIDIPVLDIACASPAILIGGGYRRRDFMWCTTLGNNDTETAWLNAHETAHVWCSGANPATWEDWLNETTAEWAALLFALSKKDTALFDFIINPKLERCHTLPPIKTADGSRPPGVHDKGTVLFYEMYKKFGEESVRVAVRTFTDLQEKNTQSFLETLACNGHDEIAAFINKGVYPCCNSAYPNN